MLSIDEIMGNNVDTIAIKQLKLIDLSKRRLNVYGNSKVRVFNNISKILYMRITKTLFLKWRLIKDVQEKYSMISRLLNNSSFLGKVNRLSYFEKNKFSWFQLYNILLFNNQSNQFINLKEQTLAFPVINFRNYNRQ